MPANDNDKQRDRGERLVGRVLTDMTVASHAMSSGVQALLEAYGADASLRRAVADFFRPVETLLGDTERAVVQHAREAGGAHALNAGLEEMVGHVVGRVSLWAEEVERAASSPRETLAAAGFSAWAKATAESWFPPKQPDPPRTKKAVVIEMDR
ncbi:MAG TPA: hypothetical protein VD866_20145 [Urbifossiella sp.]|nr:hypothetical protein [Urbifossiella sp.]